MGEIKSAFEKAMEKIEGIEKASEEESLKWKYLPEGQKIAAAYLKDECDLNSEFNKYGDKEKTFVGKGIEDVMLRNINLPVNEHIKQTNTKAMEAIKLIKKDQAALENMYNNIMNIFNHYEQEGDQQRKQAYEMLKQDFQGKMQQMMRQQGVPPGQKIDVERQPQFQEEWRRMSNQLDMQYHKLLTEYKQDIVNIN